MVSGPAAHPDMISDLARKFDTLYAHELTHVAQHCRLGTSWFAERMSYLRDVLNRNQYPIERELEAFGMQNRYLQDKAKAEILLHNMEMRAKAFATKKTKSAGTNAVTMEMTNQIESATTNRTQDPAGKP